MSPRSHSGKAGLFKRKGSPYWYIRYYVNGLEVKRSTKTTDLALAEKKRDAIVRPRLRLMGLAPARVIDVMDDYVRDCRLRGIRGPQGVIFSLNNIVSVLDDPCMPATELGHRHLRDIQERLLGKYAPATVNRALAILKSAFKLAVRNEYLDKAPRFPEMLREPPPRQGYLEPHEFERVKAELPDWAADVFEFAYFSGWRKGEILGLTWDEVDLDGKVIRLHPDRSKNLHSRLCPFSGKLEPVMSRRLEQRRLGLALVFHKDGRRIEGKLWHHVWKPARERAGKPNLFLHDMRRTAARNFIRAGIPEDVAMKLTGHRSRTMLTRYNIVSEDDLFDATEKLHRYLDAQPKEKRGEVAKFEKKGEG